MTEQWVLASSNPGKIREFNSMLASSGVEVLPQSHFAISDADETGLSFVENAIIKARHACAHTGLPALADDSGLAVNALHGAPGIYSARSAATEKNIKPSDQDNIDKLLLDLKKTGAENTSGMQAAFHCAIVFMRHQQDPTPLICHAQWRGEITFQQAGEQGFGYDPVFFLNDKNCTSAQLDRDEKNTLSHRGLAIQKLLTLLRDEKLIRV